MIISPKRFTPIAATAAAVMLLAVPSAMAGTLSHTEITVNGSKTPAGPVSVQGVNDGDVEFAMQNIGAPIECQSVAVDGYINRGASVDVGQQIGAITGLASVCFLFGPTGLPLPMEGNPGAWPITVRNLPANSGDPIDITIEGVSAYVHTTGSLPWACEMDLTGDVNATLYPGTTASGHDARIVVDTPPVFPLEVVAYNGSGTKTPVSVTCVWVGAGEGLSIQGAFNLDVDPVNPGTSPISHG